MRKWIVLGGVLVFVAAAVLAAAANLDRWLDGNRDLIEAEASAALARDVTIADLRVSLWGGFGVRVKGLRIAEDPGYGNQPFLELDEGLVHVSIWPAFFGRIEITKVALDGPRVRVVRDRSGLSTDSLAAGEAEAEVEEVAEELENDSSGFGLVIDSLVVDDGHFVFADLTGPASVELVVDRFDLEVADIGADAPLSFELAATWLGGRAPNLRAGGSVGPVLGSGTAPMTFDISFELDPLPVSPLLRLESVASSLPADTRLSGALSAKGTLRGSADAFDFDAHLDAEQLAVEMPETFIKPADSSLVLAAKGHATPAEIRVDAFAFGPAQAQVEGDARLSMSEGTPYDAKLRASSLPIEAWTPMLPTFDTMTMTGRFGLDVRARGKASDEALPLLDGRFSLADASITMPDTPPIEKLELETVLSGRKARGEGGTLELGGAPIRFEFETADLNSTLVSFAFDAATLPLAAVGVTEPGTEADDVLHALRVVGDADYGGELLAGKARFASPEGRLQGVGYRRLEGRAETSGTRMLLHELTVTMLGGQVHMNGSLDSADPEQPGFAGTIKLSDVQISEIVASQLPHLTRMASGRLHTTLTLSGRGLETDAILQSLSGVGSIEVEDGRLEGVNIAEDVLSGVTRVKGLTGWLSPDLKRKYPALFAKPDTDFQTAEMTLHVKDGRILADALAIVSDDFALIGKGTIGLDGSLDVDADFRTSVALASSLVGVADATRFLLNGEKRLQIPVHIGGDIAAPRIRPDESFVVSTLKRATLGTVGSLVGGLIGTPRKGENGAPASPDEPATSAGEPLVADDAAASPASKPQEKTGKKPRSVEGVLEQGLEDLLKR